MAVAGGVCAPLAAVSGCFSDSAGFAVAGWAVLCVAGAGCGSAGFEGAEAAGFGLAAAGALSVAARGGGGGVPCAFWSLRDPFHAA